MLFDLLEEAIITGALVPGSRIHADELAAHYGTSRIPVREALRSLHEAGWVEIKPRLGVRVRDRSEQELTELFEFRALVEARVARWAAERRTAVELTALATAIEEADGLPARPDLMRLSRANASFYQALRAAAHNSVLATSATALEKRARFYFSTVEHQLGRAWIDVHKQIFRAVEDRDGPRASELSRHHIEETGTAVRRLLFGSGD